MANEIINYFTLTLLPKQYINFFDEVFIKELCSVAQLICMEISKTVFVLSMEISKTVMYGNKNSYIWNSYVWKFQKQFLF